MESTNTEQVREQNQENLFLNFFCFRNIFETAIRYWKVAVLCAVLGTTISFAVTKWMIKPEYTSRATVFSWRDEDKINDKDKGGNELRQLQMAQMLVNDYRALLESERVRGKLAAKVYGKKANNGKVAETAEAEKKENEDNFTNYVREGVHKKIFSPDRIKANSNPKKLRYSINIETRRETRVLTIVAQASTPELAQYVAQQTAEIFQNEVKEVLHMNNVQIIDDATIPGPPANKSLKRNLPIGFIVGLLVGIALALLIGFIDQTIKNPEQAKRYLDIPVMGVIPKSQMPESRSSLIREMLDNAKSQELIEAYRLLRTNLQYLAPARKDKGGQIFMFTSSIPHEGKSSTIALVSLLTARAGKKVLLIDADMHKPVQSRIFNLRSGVGFVSVLTGDKTVEEVVQNVEESLDVMPCGPIPPNPSELLMSERMPQLLEELRQKYDYVFIDITPALFLSDPLIVKPMVDGVLFMVACSQTKIGMIQRTLRQLQQVSKTPMGLVVNQFDRGEVGNRYGYYGYYRYHSYYRYYRDYAHDDETGSETAGAKSSGEAKKSDAKKA